MARVKQDPRDRKPSRPLRRGKPLCTMVARLPPPPTVDDQASSGSDRSESMRSSESCIDIPWRYNEALCLVHHETRECSTCDDYVYHYKTAEQEEEPSFRDACSERDQALRRQVIELRRRVEELESSLREAQEAKGTQAPQPGPSFSRKRTRNDQTSPLPPVEELVGDSVGLWIIEGPLPPVQKVSTQDIWRA